MSAPDWAGPRTILELWHPSGAPERRLGLGGAASGAYAGDDGERIDFALVAPLAAELSALWLRRAIGTAGPRLEAEGMLCVVVPRRWRRASERLIRQAGLVPRGGLLTVPPWPGCAHAVSLDAAALQDAGTRLLGLRRASAACGAGLVRGGAGRALARLAAPGCALIATRRPGAEPLRWLAALDGAAGTCAAAATSGVRDDARVAVVMRYAPSGHAPDLVAKVALSPGGHDRVERERAALATFATGARRAGAAVPSVVATGVHAQGVLATRALPGRPARALLARDPGGASAILGAVSGWLGRWAAQTESTATADHALLAQLLIAPAARVAAIAADDAMASYVAALRQLAARLEGSTLVLTAAHDDLTMANVLVTAAGDIGVVDWESARAAAPPLADEWYAFADGLARSRGLTHAQAVAELARGRSPIAAALADRLQARSRELALTTDEALLAFHACWLRHACNELDHGTRSGPFCAVVRTVAAGRLRWPAHEDGAAR